MWVHDKLVGDVCGCTHVSGLLSRHSVLSRAKTCVEHTHSFQIRSSNTRNHVFHNNNNNNDIA